MKEPKKMVGKEIAFMKKMKAPKSMIKHEKAEAGMKSGGKMGAVKTSSKPDGVIKKGGTKGKMIAMKMGGKAC